MTAAPSSERLRLGGEDVLDIIGEIERSIDRRMPEARLARVETIGDLARETLEELRAAYGDQGRRCLTAMAFHHLRAAMGQPRLRPATPLRAAWSGRWRDLEDRLDLDIEPPITPLQGATAIGGVAAALLALVVGASGEAMGAALLTGLGVLLIAASARLSLTAPPPDVSAGELARALVAANLGRLAAEGGRLEERSVGAAVLRLVARIVGRPVNLLSAETKLC